MAWISVHQQIRDHRKTRELFRLLKVSRQEAIGILVLIWLWAIDNANKDGLLLSVTIEDIADAAYWKGDPQELYKALLHCRWIDEQDGNIYIHDWGDFNKYFYQYIDKKEKDKKRKFHGKSTGNSTENPLENPTDFHDSHSPAHSHSPSHSPNNTAGDKTPADVFKFYQDNIGMIMRFQQELLESYLADEMEPALIIDVMERSLGKSDKLSWIKKVLNNLLNENIRTMEQQAAKRVEFENQKAKDQKKTWSDKKTPNKGNFEQRTYDDEYYNSLYDNMRGE